MKTRLSLICMVIFLTAMNVADAQLHHPHFGGGLRGGPGLGTGGQSAFRQVRGDVQAGVPGRFWFETNVADEGLGYDGSYLTVGGKRRLFEDFLDGRWLFEAQLHHSIDEDEGDFFTNIGIERVFSIPAAGADVSIGGWYDYNDETDADFSNPFHQVGISGAIKSRRWDLLANGYFPIGDTDVALGDPTGQIPFAQNFLVRETGIDAAQTGFDVTMRLRPKQLAFANGTIDFGGYGYKSDLVDFFGGGRVRLGFQALRGAIVSAEVNHDDRFSTTGVLSVGWIFGATGGVGGEYAGLARDLEPTLRNDHIVRVTREAAFVINPITGLPYNVLHVNNQGGIDGSGEGTFERPFLTLREAELAGVDGDAIFVDSGDGTSRNYQEGIDLKRNQLLLGDGGTYGVPDAADGSLFPLVTGGGIGPTITNPGEPSVVELADNNRIAGVNINASGATYGINGEVINGGTLEDVTVSNAGQDGVRLFNVFGDWDFRDNNFSNNGASGLLVDGVFNNASRFLLENNVANSNGLDGIAFRNFDPGSFVLNANTTNGNQRYGLLLNNFANSAGNGLNILNHVADANVNSGIVVDRGNGKLNIFSPNVTNSGLNGIRITNWSNVVGENTVISGVGGTMGLLSNNGLGGANLLIELNEPDLLQNVLVTNTTINGSGGIGIEGLATGIDTVMNIDIRDGVTVTNNRSDGISLVATDSGTINANIGSADPTSPPLRIINNGFLDGNGISLIARGISAQPMASINAVVQNVTILNDQSIVTVSDGTSLFGNTTGVNINSIENAIVDVLVANSTIGSPALTPGLDVTTGVNIFLDNDTSIGRDPNRIVLDNLELVVGYSAAVAGNGGTGVLINTLPDTLSDIVISNSTIRPNGQPVTPPGPNNGVFGDTIGNSGILVLATGTGNLLPLPFPIVPSGLGGGLAGPGSTIGGNVAAADFVSDGVEDNLTRIQMLNNTIRDFTFDGVSIAATGDAQLLLDISGNSIINNGAGVDNDSDNDNVFNEGPIPGAPSVTNLAFFDGINIDAFQDSVVSARISVNLFQDNFERGLSLNTFDDAELNVIVSDNGFVGNDRGEDTNIQSPQITNPAMQSSISTAGIFDLEAINNEEYYFRLHESPVFVLQGNEGIMGGGNGALFNPLTGAVVPNPGTGVFIPGNFGVDIFGNPIPIGTADLNLAISNNGFQNLLDIQDFSQPPGDLTLSLNGSNTAASPVNFGQTLTTLGAVDGRISAEEASFEIRGFIP